MKYRIRKLENGMYLPEHKVGIIFKSWAAVDYDYEYDDRIPKSYATEKEAIRMIKADCEFWKKVAKKEQEAKDYEPKLFTCKDFE